MDIGSSKMAGCPFMALTVGNFYTPVLVWVYLVPSKIKLLVLLHQVAWDQPQTQGSFQ